MNAKGTRRLVLSLVGIVVVTLGSARAAEGLVLGKYMPADVHFLSDSKDTPEGARLMEGYWRALEKLCDSGIGRDLFELATMELSPAQREQALAMANRVIALISTPNWKALLSGEVAVAYRIGIPIPQYIILFRVPQDSVGARVGEFAKALQGIAELASGQLSVRQQKRGEVEVTSLVPMGAPISLSVAAKRDVVALAVGDMILDDVLRLMDSAEGRESIVAQDRFREAFEGLPAPEDGLVYVDMGGMINFVRGVVSMASMGAGGDPTAAGVVSIVSTILEEVARVNAIAVSNRTDGDRLFADFRVSMLQKDGPGFIERLIAEQKPLENVERVVPRDALEFYATAGIDLEKIYVAIIDLIRARMPKGDEMLAQWEAMQKELGFHLQRDLLSWLGGTSGWVTLPGGPWGTENALVIGVKDRAKVEELLERIGRCIKTYLESRGQGIAYVPVEGPVDGLYEIRIDALPFLRPVVGVLGGGSSGSLVLASSREAFARVVATMRGEAPAIAENPRFAAIGMPGGPVCDVYYANTENSFAGFANLLGALGFVGSLLPESKDTKPLIKGGRILTRLATFVRDIDLGMDYGSFSRYEAERHAVIGRTMTRLRVPGPAKDKF